jgi:hypothetical protein
MLWATFFFHIVTWSHFLSFVPFFLFILHAFYIKTSIEESEKLDNRGAIIPEKFLDPCNFTNVIPLNEIQSMKNTIEAINIEKNCINTVAKYNISADANEYLRTKITNLTTTSNNLKKQLKEQKEIRFDCYKQNLQKRCEEKSRSKNLEKLLIIYCFYVCISLTLLSVSYCFILKAIMGLSQELKKMYDNIMYVLIFLTIFDIAYPLPIIFTNLCSVESDLEKFDFL